MVSFCGDFAMSQLGPNAPSRPESPLWYVWESWAIKERFLCKVRRQGDQPFSGCPQLRYFPGDGTFSAKTRTVSGKQGQCPPVNRWGSSSSSQPVLTHLQAPLDGTEHRRGAWGCSTSSISLFSFSDLWPRVPVAL